VCLDDQGWHELASELTTLAARVEEIQSQSRTRLGEPPEPPDATGPTEVTRPTPMTMADAENGSDGTTTATAPTQRSAPTQRLGPTPGAAAEPRHEATLVLILYEDPPAPPAND
jgi:hypothetical protein